jgi:PAT family beta-lactamase induction signal transducer AmpG
MTSWLQSLKIYQDYRILAVLFLGFASGLPLLLVYATLSAWLAESDVSKTAIGLFSWVSAAYSIKFLWSPLVDQIRLPLLGRLLGQRRSWLCVAQFGVIGGIIGMSFTDPGLSPWHTALWAVVLAFASATQDIVIDAYRVEILHESQQGAGAGAIVLGYRGGMLVSGGGALLLADFYGWHAAYMIMAVIMVFAIVVTLLIKEPPEKASTTQADDAAQQPFFMRAVIYPFRDFMTRPNWILILAFVAFYKYGDALLGVMANPFYLDLGFSKAEIGVISKGWGLVMTILGGLLGGILVARYGIMRALLICGVAQAFSNVVFMAQAYVGYSLPMLSTTIAVENLTGGMGTAAFVAYLGSLCNVAYTATQYALLSSLMAFARTFFASGGGWLADQVSWITYFAITTLAAIPGLLLLVLMMRRYPKEHVSVQRFALDDD